VALGLFLGLAIFLGFSAGPVGRWLEQGVRVLVGRAVVAVPLILLVVGLAVILRHALLGSRPFRLGLAIGGIALLIALAAGAIGLGGTPRRGWFDLDVMTERGGYVGELGYFATSHTVGGLGTAVLVVMGLIAAAILISGASLGVVLQRSGTGAARAGRTVGRGMRTATVSAVRTGQRLGEGVRTRLDAAPTLTGVRRVRLQAQQRAAAAKRHPLLDGADDFPDIFEPPSTLPPSPALGPAHEPAVEAPVAAAVAVADAPPAARVHVPPPVPRTARRDAEDAEELEQLRIEDEPAPASAAEADTATRYRPPPATLLRQSTGPTSQPPERIAATSRVLEEALGHFGIEAKVSGTVSGPRVTRYELQLAPGTKVGRVTALRDDLAYALAAREELRIIAPIPGKQAVGVEVPNPEASLVTLGDILREFPAHAGPLMAWLGLDISGKPIYVDLARMPHLLIAGSTGTGKSVCLNAILASILLRSTPEQLRMILIDPKKVELNHYEGIPHLLTPVVTNMRDAAAVLANVVREMESRYELMGMARARNLRDWNAIRERAGDKPLPTVLVVIDELADLMMVSPAEVEDSIIRLAQKSRAVGIHLVLATQRPSADVITGMIKANVPSRIAFAVSSQVDSRVILDAGGAESLLGHGDMLFRPVGSSRLQRLQGAYVSEEEILAITDDWRRQGKPQLRTELLERPEPVEDALVEEADDLLERAIEMVVQQGTASVSLLQRRLGVGYARAGRLVDAMEQLGVISGHEGSKPRTVLIGEGDLHRFIRRPEPAPADDDEPDGLAD
jgi:S-DNA-T family DNA segregation ATPase FtsK/SpoIIIE